MSVVKPLYIIPNIFQYIIINNNTFLFIQLNVAYLTGKLNGYNYFDIQQNTKHAKIQKQKIIAAAIAPIVMPKISQPVNQMELQ